MDPRLRWLLAAALAAMLPACGGGGGGGSSSDTPPATSPGQGTDLAGYLPFPADNAWNQDISSLPVASDSDAILTFIGKGASLKGDFGSGFWDGGPIGIPFVVVSGAQPRVAIHYTAYGNESDPGPMPIPADAPVEGGSAATGDRHVLVLDRDHRVLYELYRAFRQSDGSWNADAGTIWDLDSNALRPWGWTSADAAGLSLLPGLVKYEEAASGAIRHALRFTVPMSRQAYLPPATHWASSTSNASAPPMGLRVRLKASTDLSAFGPRVKVILQALKQYGMILADNGSAWYVSGAPDARWDNDELRQLESIKGSDLEVVDTGTAYTADPTGPAPAISVLTASSTGGVRTVSWTATGATRAFLNPGPGLVKGTSAVVSSPGTYTLTLQGPHGSATRQVIVP